MKLRSWIVRPRGLSLIEVMVASTLALLAIGLCLTLFFPAMRAWKDGQKRSEVGQSVLMTSTWFGDDVVRSSPGSIQLTPEGIVVMKCAQGQTVNHENPFSQSVAYWQEDGALYRTTKVLADSETTPPSTLAEIKALPDRRRVASGVTKFEVLVNPEQPWLVSVALEVEKDGRKGTISTAYSSIYAPADREILEAEE